MLPTMLSQHRGKKVVALFGEVLADVFPDQSVLGGAPFNVARHLQAFGLYPVMISRTGNDALRDALLAEMRARGMDSDGIQCDPSHPTGQVQVLAENGTHRFDILPDQAYDHIHADITRMITMAARPQMLYFGTLAQRAMTSRLALDKFLNAAKCPRLLDLNLRAPWYDRHTIRRSLRRADIVKLNEEEFDIVTAQFRIRNETPQARARALMQQFELSLLLVTRGAGGAWLIDVEAGMLETGPAVPDRPIVDTVGAGDAFAAVFMTGLLQRWELATTLERANRFAAALCTVRGGAPQSSAFYQPFLAEWWP